MIVCANPCVDVLQSRIPPRKSPVTACLCKTEESHPRSKPHMNKLLDDLNEVIQTTLETGQNIFLYNRIFLDGV
jgi:hypothetical protein